MWPLNYFEYALGSLLSLRRGYDADCLFNSAPFADHREPTIPITSTDCGESGGKLSYEHSAWGAGVIPSLSWPTSTNSDVKEYVLVAEDPDVPFGFSAPHGIYLGISPQVTGISPADLELVRETEDGIKEIKGGWRVGKNMRNVIYIPARPPRGHGAHRYIYQLVALSERLDLERMSKVPTKAEVVAAIDGKIVSWGVWQGTYESRV